MNEETGPTKEDAPKLDTSTAGLQRRWMLRLQAAKDFFEAFHEEGGRVNDEFLGKGGGSRLNLFFADVQTKAATLSGFPKVRARRRFADAKDNTARVSAMVLDRLLNSDIERASDGYRKALANAKGDWLRAGLGQVWLRYSVESEPITDETTGEPVVVEGQPQERKAREDVETDHAKWRRFLWDPSETWEDVRAIYRGLDLTKAEWERQFPGRTFRVVGKKGTKADEVKEAFGRAEVWEIWDKETRTVYHLSEQERTILKVTEDPYGLPGFFPCPEPLMANVTTDKCIPRSTYYLAKDQYDEANELQRRIRALVKQVKVCGVYDSGNEGLKNLLSDAYDGKLIPVKNWAALIDKGGLQNAFSLMPLKERVEAIIALSERLALVKREIYEVTGQSDIMRGQAAEKATATEQRIKARFGSTRIQAEQDELARFASEAQRIRAFLISKFFDEETIAQRANIQAGSDDAQVLPEAVALLKSSISDYRIDVDAESLSMTDYDAEKQDGLELLQTVGLYIKQIAEVGPMAPWAVPGLLGMLKSAVARMRGAANFEADLDRLVKQAEEVAQQAMAPKPPPPPDPKVEAEKVKAGATQMKAQADVAKAQMGIQKTAMDAQVEQASFGMRMAEIQAKQAAAADVEGPV